MHLIVNSTLDSPRDLRQDQPTEHDKPYDATDIRLSGVEPSSRR
jgi:hypothetical protein